ncbi:DMT family transporter [Maribellus sp. YY47]|uniref:DMT family transporter n=1 Tax=Maribellus sp. YY47 TaxID=2929486 RepID=UPI00200199AC|nr:DMT family transporter [Maribellus sp. YY47]MCK3684491.1 DMT family transporter [Maribellus sp. YY47]
MQNHTKGIIYASITAFFWGFLAIALKIAVRKVDPPTIVWFRFVIAFIMLSAWLMYKNRASFRILTKPPLLLIFAAIALSWNYMGYMLGIHRTTPSNAQLFIQTGPLILAMAGIVLFKEKLSRNQVIGFIIALAGFSFFYRDQLSAFFDSRGDYQVGILLTISGAVAWSVYAILQKKLVAFHPVDALNLFLFGFPAIAYLPFVNFDSLLHLHWTWWLLLVFLGMNTFIAYTCVANALKYTEANKVSIILILNPMITFITMGILTELNVSWVEHERFSLITVAGVLLVFAGAILVVRKSKKRIKEKNPLKP